MILLLSTLDLIAPTNAVKIEVPASALLYRFQEAIRRARKHMNRPDHALPLDYMMGGACYTGFGTSMNLAQCRGAIAQMPDQHPDVDDIVEGYSGPILTRNFDKDKPLIWRSNDCLIGVSLMDVPRAKGLYPLFREAAQLIFDKCVMRSRGGMIRFGHFEVVLFDAKLLPGYEQQATPEFIRNFALEEDNIPFSKGLIRIDQIRDLIAHGFDVGNIWNV
ncbi:hypothetical protein MMC17_002582 [Xylographa soralifera]|nr:hypothetical protein [Xylographa soralifera]